MIRDVLMDMWPALGMRRLLVILGLFSMVGATMWLVGRAKTMHGRIVMGSGTRLDVGRVIGVCGVPGAGKTSLMVGTWGVPALQTGRTVIANFTIYPEASWPGKFVLMEPDTYGQDLLGIGSSLNRDGDGEPMSGWYVDTACTCGKDHDSSCARPHGDVPPKGKMCCEGFRARRDCSCNGAILFVDEGHAFLPANGSKPLPVDVQTWATMVRKNHLMLIWATQYYKWMHSGIRRLSEQVFMCGTHGMDGKHMARLHLLDFAKGDISRDPVHEVAYDNRAIRAFYDTKEVIVAAGTAHELAGSLSRKHILAEVGRGARHEHPAPGDGPRLLRFVPPPDTIHHSQVS